jgi:hypothetical protein
MGNQIVQTLWGEQVFNTAPKCSIPGCTNHCHSTGYGRYRKVCHEHHVARTAVRSDIHKKFRKDYCENKDGRLGFICTGVILQPRWQLDADHIDGNSKNNNASNIQTLCKNCHAMKTMQNEENMPHSRRKSFLSEKK